MPSINDLSDSELFRTKTNLEKIQEDRIRSEEQYRIAMQDLEEQGYDSIEESKEGLEDKLKRIQRLEEKANKEYQAFMEEHDELLER